MALADREFVFDGSAAWTVGYALRVLNAKGCAAAVAPTLSALTASLNPVPREWLGDRLTILWAMFMASRTTTDVDAMTLWLAEHLRLLGDLPHDIVAKAIDRAIQAAKHGFIPSIGEVRAIAEPLVAHRERMAERLKLIGAAAVASAQ